MEVSVALPVLRQSTAVRRTISSIGLTAKWPPTEVLGKIDGLSTYPKPRISANLANALTPLANLLVAGHGGPDLKGDGTKLAVYTCSKLLDTLSLTKHSI